MPSRPFDLSLMNYEKSRHIRRRRLLVASILPTVLVIVVAVWFIYPVMASRASVAAYKKGNYKTARNWVAVLPITSPQPFVANFDLGTANAALGNYDEAESELTKALGLAKKEQKCMVAKNLVFTFEQQAKTKSADAKQVNIFSTKAEKTRSAYPKCFKQKPPAAGGGGGGSSNQTTESLSEAEQQQLQQKEALGRERQAQFAREEEFNSSDPIVKRW